jgi:hypothetical protein
MQKPTNLYGQIKDGIKPVGDAPALNRGAPGAQAVRAPQEMERNQVNIERINVDWNNNVHIISFAYLDPHYVKLKSFRIPNNSITIIVLTDKYLLVVSNDDGDFIETFESFEELNNYLKQYFKVELNTPPWECQQK